jgi:DNA-binding MarR family transcriptional regulator
MVDLKSGADPLFLREENLSQGVDLLFFAWRDFTRRLDPILAEAGIGRAHHRALHFIARNPGIIVSDLQDLLGITKQSLARVLKQLIEDGLVEQTPGAVDRRQRRLNLTAAGKALEGQLSRIQREQLAAAYRRAGADAVEGFRNVLAGLRDASEPRR